MAENAFAAGDTPSPHPTPLDAFDASIFAPSTIAMRGASVRPVVQSKKILKLYYADYHHKFLSN